MAVSMIATINPPPRRWCYINIVNFGSGLLQDSRVWEITEGAVQQG